MTDESLRAIGYQFAPQASAIVDASNGRFMACNRAFSVLLGFSEEELVGQSVDVVVPSHVSEGLRDALDATRTSPLLGHEAVFTFRREDGSDLSGRMRSRLIDDRWDGPPRIVIAVDEVDSAPTERDDFLALLAHELRNHLSNARLTVQLLRREEAPNADRVRWGLSVMSQQIEALRRLTDNLLDLSRMARGVMTIERQPLDLTKLLRSIADSEPAEPEQPSVIELSVPDTPVAILGDERRLHRALVLLIELVAHKGPDPIALSLTDDGRHANVVVRAERIDAELLHNADASSTTTDSGLGLEAQLVRGLIEQMDGEIRVAPKAVSIRLLKSEVVPLPSTELGAGDRAADGHVLVVDDDRGAANTLALLLSSSGLVVEMAHDGEHGLKMAMAHRPKAALLDLKLPGMDGYALARQLRERFGPEMTLIALTGLDDPADRERAKEAGFDHHLVKPPDVDELKSLLR